MKKYIVILFYFMSVLCFAQSDTDKFVAKTTTGGAAYTGLQLRNYINNALYYPILAASGADLNSEGITAKYIFRELHAGDNKLNFPIGAYSFGQLHTIKTDLATVQMYYPDYNSPIRWRTNWNGDWRPWRTLLDDNSFAATIGNYYLKTNGSAAIVINNGEIGSSSTTNSVRLTYPGIINNYLKTISDGSLAMYVDVNKRFTATLSGVNSYGSHSFYNETGTTFNGGMSNVGDFSAKNGSFNGSVSATRSTGESQIFCNYDTTKIYLYNNSNSSGIYSDVAGFLAYNKSGKLLSLYDNKVTILQNGNLGIGMTPISKLHLSGDIQQENANYVKGTFANGTTRTRLLGLNSGNALYIGSIDASQSSTLFVNNGVPQMTITQNGSIGIGTTTPTQKLDVNGITKTTNLQVTTGANSGYVATSDTSGNLSWSASLDDARLSSNIAKKNGTNTFSGLNTFSDVLTTTYISGTDASFSNPVQVGFASAGNHAMNRNAADVRYQQIGTGLTLQTTVVSTSSNSITATANNYCFIFSGGTSGNSLVFPSPSSCFGRIYIVVNRSSNSVSLTGGYYENGTIFAAFDSFSRTQMISDGTNWIKIN